MIDIWVLLIERADGVQVPWGLYVVEVFCEHTRTLLEISGTLTDARPVACVHRQLPAGAAL